MVDMPVRPCTLTIARRLADEGTISLGGGVRYWADAPENGPDGWAARAIVTFLFPKR